MDYFGPFWSILDCKDPFRTQSTSFDLLSAASWPHSVSFGLLGWSLFGLFWSLLPLFGLCWTLSAYFGILHGLFPASFDLFSGSFGLPRVSSWKISTRLGPCVESSSVAFLRALRFLSVSLGLSFWSLLDSLMAPSGLSYWSFLDSFRVFRHPL